MLIYVDLRFRTYMLCRLHPATSVAAMYESSIKNEKGDGLEWIESWQGGMNDCVSLSLWNDKGYGPMVGNGPVSYII